MRTVCMVIGSMVLAAIFIAIPILLSVSLCLGWDSFLSFILIVGVLFEYCMVVDFILAKIKY